MLKCNNCGHVCNQDYSINELFEGTHREISEQKQFGKMEGTKLLVLKNSKIG